MVWSWLQRHPRLTDLAIVFALGSVYVGREVHLHRLTGGVALALLAVMPLLVRRRWPLAVLILATAATLVEAGVYGPVFPVAAAVAAYTLAEQWPRRGSLTVTTLVAAAVSLAALVVDGYHGALSALVPFALAWVIGDNLGTRRAYTRALEERADRLEREREAEAARAVAEEQARIARELHDVVAHNVSVMVVQAAAANDVFETRPDRARDALRAIEATGRGALVELRRLLGAVRGEYTEFAPQPGLDRMDELIDAVRSAGLEIELRIDGQPGLLPAAVEVSAFRVIQEALTNVLKHSHATRAEIVLRYADTGLDVEVRDDGTGGTVNGGGVGYGLIGMRERVAAFGGSLDAGPVPTGGFAVTARFPL